MGVGSGEQGLNSAIFRSFLLFLPFLLETFLLTPLPSRKKYVLWPSFRLEKYLLWKLLKILSLVF